MVVDVGSVALVSLVILNLFQDLQSSNTTTSYAGKMLKRVQHDIRGRKIVNQALKSHAVWRKLLYFTKFELAFL